MKDFTPFLKYYGERSPRALSSMTRDEFIKLSAQLSLDLNVSFSSKPTFADRPWHVVILENRVRTNTLKFNDGIVLIEAGFWVFGDEYFSYKDSLTDES